jgi:Flp pilus assembly pilin Flp
MTLVSRVAKQRPHDQRGASMVEYILLVALIALAVIAAVLFLHDQVNGKFNESGSKLSNCGVMLPVVAGLSVTPAC